MLYAVLYAVLNDRWVTCRREFKMDVLFVGLSFLNLGCFLVILLYLGKNYIPEWLHDMFQWGKTMRETKQSSWIQYLHVPNRWVETSGKMSDKIMVRGYREVTCISYSARAKLNIASSLLMIITP